MATKVYDSNQVSISICGIPVDTTGGYADDEFLTIEQDSDDFDDVVGTDGEVTRSKTNDRRATVYLKLMQSSSTNAFLSALNLLDKNAPNGAGIGPFWVRDRQGTSLYTGATCWIAKPPDVSFGRTAKERSWKIRIGSIVRTDGGN